MISSCHVSLDQYQRPTTRPGGKGFTLIELMVVVAILAILVGAAVPSLGTFLEAQQVKGLAYDLTTDLILARNEALKRNLSVAIVHSGDSWNKGWATNTVVTPTATLLSTRSLTASGVVVTDAPTSITFDVNGRVSAPASEVRMTLTSVTGGSSRCVEISLSGRARSYVGSCT